MNKEMRVITIKDLQHEFGISEATAKRYRRRLRAAGLLVPMSAQGRRTLGDMQEIRRAFLRGDVGATTTSAL